MKNNGQQISANAQTRKNKLNGLIVQCHASIYALCKFHSASKFDNHKKIASRKATLKSKCKNARTTREKCQQISETKPKHVQIQENQTSATESQYKVLITKTNFKKTRSSKTRALSSIRHSHLFQMSKRTASMGRSRTSGTSKNARI